MHYYVQKVEKKPNGKNDLIQSSYFKKGYMLELKTTKLKNNN
jgi:hypothetical protein